MRRQRICSRGKNLWRHLRSTLHPEVVAEEDDVDIGTDRAEKLLQIGQVHLDHLVEKGMGPPRFPGQQQKEIVIAVHELPHLQQIAAEQANDAAVGLLAQALGTRRANL